MARGRAPDKVSDPFFELSRLIEEHPDIDSIVRAWEASDSEHPEYITHHIYDFVVERKVGFAETIGLYRKYDRQESMRLGARYRYDNDAFVIASNIADLKLRELKIDGRNCARLLNHVRSFDSASAYGALLVDYTAYLDPAQCE